MARVAFLRLALVAGVVAVVAASDPVPSAGPLVLAAVLVAVVVAATIDRDALLDALAAATSSLLLACGRVLVAAPEPRETPGLARRHGLAELARRGAFRRLRRPDVPGKPRARAPGRA